MISAGAGWDRLAEAGLEVGDIVHVQSDALVSRLIRTGSKQFGERPSWSSHTEHVLAIEAGEAVDMSVLNGRPRPLRFSHWRGRARVLVTRVPGGLSDRQKERMIQSASSAIQSGLGYGWLKIGAHGADWMLGGGYFFRRICLMENFPICSYDVARRYNEVTGDRFLGKDPKACQPDDILDHCALHAWPIVWADSPQTLEAFRVIYQVAAAMRTMRFNPGAFA